ncbi:hypothetical protein SDC9_102618 [bioreactor metagenome]|uniref:Uncharacterized protein n=1 Tax=bioreactor metagenome TaxID=1076179 RepID=A0A645AU54_9ZZZZ
MFIEKFFFQFIHIDNFTDSYHCKPAHMRIYNNRLRLCIADYTDTTIPGKTLDIVFKFIPEVPIFQTVNCPLKSFFFREKSQTRSFCT